MDHSEYGQIGRIFRIFIKLMQNNGMTIKSIHQHLNNEGFTASRRTVERDIQKMVIEGIPIQWTDEDNDAKRNKEYYIDRDYLNWILSKVPLHEQIAQRIIEKLLPPSEEIGFPSKTKDISLLHGDRDEKGCIWFDAKFVGFYNYREHRDILSRLIDAILRKCVCQADYFALDSEVVKTYTIEPYRLLFYRGGLYVMAMVRRRRKIASLAVERIQGLRLTNGRFEEKHSKGKREFKKDQFGMFESYPIHEVILQFDKIVVPHIQSRLWHESQREEIQKDGSLLLHLNLGLSAELVSWVLSWGSGVRVIKPQELKEHIKAIAKSITEM